MGIPQESAIIREDNAGVLKWSSGDICQDFRRSKHVDLHYNHVREKVRDASIKLEKESSAEMLADFLTKQLYGDAIKKALDRMHIKSISRDLGEEAC